MIDSSKISDLNRVFIRYVDGKTTHTLFQGNPLYLVDGNLPDVKFSVNAPNLWEPLKGLTNGLRAGIQFLGSTGIVGGDWGHFSGCIDLRQKFVFQGSAPQNFDITCLLINREGWDVSIAPYLNELADWVLPRRVERKDGTPYYLGESFNPKDLTDYMATDAIASANENWDTMLEYINTGLTNLKAWVGETHVLMAPKQLEYLNTKHDTTIEIGRLVFRDIYISDVNISVPRGFMTSGTFTDLNSDTRQNSEPDSVQIKIGIKSLRQTTTSNMKF